MALDGLMDGADITNLGIMADGTDLTTMVDIMLIIIITTTNPDMLIATLAVTLEVPIQQVLAVEIMSLQEQQEATPLIPEELEI